MPPQTIQSQGHATTPAPPAPLTDTQAAVLLIIGWRIAANGHAPTLREVAAQRGTHHAAVYEIVEQLVERGYVGKVPSKKQGLWITERGQAWLQANTSSNPTTATAAK